MPAQAVTNLDANISLLLFLAKFTGESNVYTLGNIGAHRIVSTKLPSVGSTREAMTATGNTTTRLLGTFQKVDFVFVVGVAGGVPHYTDYKKHVRLGDVVISYVDKQSALSNRWPNDSLTITNMHVYFTIYNFPALKNPTFMCTKAAKMLKRTSPSMTPCNKSPKAFI